MREIVVLRNTSELGAGTRGASLGAQALEVAALNKGSDIFGKLASRELKHRNRALYSAIDTPFAKRIEDIARVYDEVSAEVMNILEGNRFPLVIAGDHSSAGGTIAGVKKTFPSERIGVVWIDAHGDLHSPYTSPSGNVHGMPLAIALGQDNREYGINDIVEKTDELWEYLKNIHGLKPKIYPEDLLMYGVRDTEMPEDKLMEMLQIKNYTVEEVRKSSAIRVAREGLERLNNCEKIYISFDVDVLDCDKVSHGTGTPVPDGLMPNHVIDILREFIKSGKVCCLEIVEINPTLDEKQNKMAEAAFEILEAVFEDLNNQLNP